ncbi:hypothetical protein NDU88_005149 [Pleurodeles waltl]|uniref:Uncharacterized protein n=1 Tax=Pleurodeles waltl TaxID=8319 RepID=A0AAV7QJX4_PLEWA|nr:hypothetical protein NDU88_005149 [Pleurodeles waltl]
METVKESGIQDGGRISRLIATTALAISRSHAAPTHPRKPRTLCACSTDRCGRFTVFWRPPLGSGRIGKHRRAPQEDASKVLALDPRSCSSRRA